MKKSLTWLVAAAAIVISVPIHAAPPRGNTHYQPSTARGVAVQKIVRTWADYARTMYGGTSMAWAKSMQQTFAEAELSNLQKAARMQTFEGMMGTLLGQQVTDEKIITAQAIAESGGASPKTIGSAAGDLVFTMVTPCRILDTRNAIGRLTGGVVRSFYVHGSSFASQGGVASSCNIPADPSAVAINVVAVNPAAEGFLSIFPVGGSVVAASLNYSAGRNQANEIIAKTTIGQPNDLSVFPQENLDLVIDIVGYFMAPEATAVQCTTKEEPITVNASQTASKSLACDAGYSVTGGGCFWLFSEDRGEIFSSTVSGNGYLCRGRNDTGAQQELYARTQCCRIPGR